MYTTKDEQIICIIKLRVDLHKIQKKLETYHQSMGEGLLANVFLNTRFDSVNARKALDSLKMGRCYLRKMLGSLEPDSHPYSNDGKRKTADDVEEAADLSDSESEDLRSETPVQKVDKIREELKSYINFLENLKGSLENDYRLNLSHEEAIRKLMETRFWLGYELETLTDEPSVTNGDEVTGMMILFGTGGDMEGGTIDFESMFYNPEAYNLYAFREKFYKKFLKTNDQNSNEDKQKSTESPEDSEK